MFDDDAQGFADYITQAQFLQPSGPRPMLGVTVADPDPQLREQLKLGAAPAVVISEVRPGTPAADAKLQTNDVIQAVNGQPVTNTMDLQKLVGAAKPDAPVKLKILRAGQTLDVPVTVKVMAPPEPRGFPPGFSGMMGSGSNADLVNEINALKQRVQMLEARVRALEQRAGAMPSGPGGPPKTTSPPVPRGGAQPDR
jgi:membrane-associated protease RseP (regulator of RpoE activity)